MYYRTTVSDMCLVVLLIAFVMLVHVLLGFNCFYMSKLNVCMDVFIITIRIYM